jgi:hypothetical protein
MSLVHPIKRIQVAGITFAAIGIALAIGAEPANSVLPESGIVVAPIVEIDAPVTASAARRAWREQLPAVIVLRRPRTT